MRQRATSLDRRSSPSTLRGWIVAALLVVSLLPLALVGGGSWVVFGRLLERKSLELQRSVVASHAASVEAFLAHRRGQLEVLARTHRREELVEPGRLRGLLDALNLSSEGSFVDLGVIGADGSHLAYLGPYDLSDRNYAAAEWFREVMVAGVFTSDVFLGFRKVPHFVIAVRGEQDGQPWVLRATVDPATFDRLVQTGMLGRSSEAFLVNAEGLYQTTPRLGSVLDRAPLPPLRMHSGVSEARVTVDGVDKLRVSTWINGNRWKLVVQQDVSEVRAPLTQAATVGALVISIAVLVLVLTTFAATRLLQRQIDRANRLRQEMTSAFIRSAKLASVGELATGLAHEVNNPLAIISAEQTNLADLVELSGLTGDHREEMLESTRRIRAQVARCGGITKKMLQFGRMHESVTEPVDLPAKVAETVRLLERQASVRNISLLLDAETDLPPVLVDPLELEQVLVNLVNNAFQAMPEGGSITLAARRVNTEVWLEVRDTGRGMTPEILDRIFEPFFTTKAVGQGTGLGLAVCYGIVSSWGGTIEAESTPGQGTTMRLRLAAREG